MESRTTAAFRKRYGQLPREVRAKAKAAYRQFISNPQHPGLFFKKLPPHEDIWSVRIDRDYRAIGRWRSDTVVWFFIGSHAEYDQLIDQL
ncbi:MAG TPA: hypothetical protein VD997_14890 [Phycisphaerales bacterium]|nr:hypothetical protein [Phycisphaerales bacterium]